jgi:hypothetical protein
MKMQLEVKSPRDGVVEKINFEKDRFKLDSAIKILGRHGSYTCQNFLGIKTMS